MSGESRLRELGTNIAGICGKRKCQMKVCVVPWVGAAMVANETMQVIRRSKPQKTAISHSPVDASVAKPADAFIFVY